MQSKYRCNEDGNYRLLGYIHPNNVQDGTALSFVANTDSESELVKLARKSGGDAIIYVSQNNQLMGYNGYVSSNGAGGLTATTNTTRQIAVIKYKHVPKEPLMLTI